MNDSGIDALNWQLDALRGRLRIAVIYNGDSADPGAVINKTHNPRSDKSYRSVAQDIAAALTSLGFRHVLLLPDDLTLATRLRAERVDLAWLNTAGVQGYDCAAHTPSLMELAGVPYVGHRPLLAMTLDNKHVFKRALQELGLPTSRFTVWDGATDRHPADAGPRFAQVFGSHPGPFVAKPVSGRASLHVTLAPDRLALREAAQEIHERTLNPVLIEPFLPGPEYCIAVCGAVVARNGVLRRRAAPFTFSAVERLLDKGEAIFTSMDRRAITRDRVRLLDDDRHGPGEALARLARSVYLDMGLRTIARLDVRADAHGQLNILEANPKPDLKRPTTDAMSLVCAELPALGMSYEDLILTLLANQLDQRLNSAAPVRQRRGALAL